jgi:hypothetical protein
MNDWGRRTMKFWKWALALAVVIGMAVVPSAQAETSGVQTIFSPSASAGFVDPGVMYARAITLQHNGAANGTMLSTFETYTNGTPCSGRCVASTLREPVPVTRRPGLPNAVSGPLARPTRSPG